jgi:hypothetical protein
MISFACILLFTDISSFIWKYVPYFKYIQFPARWMSILVFSTMALSGPFFYYGEAFFTQRIFVLSLLMIIVALFVITDVKYVRAACIFSHEELYPVKGVDWTPEHLPQGVSQRDIDRNNDPSNRVVVKKGMGTANVISWDAERRVLQTDSESGLVIRIRTFNFPGWTGFVDEKEAVMRTEPGTGAILVDVPTGNHTVLLVFLDTPVRVVGKIISLCTVMVLTIFLIYSGVRKGIVCKVTEKRDCQDKE